MMSVFSAYSDSRMSLPPLDTSASSPADSLGTPFPLTPSDPYMPSWALRRITIPTPIARIAKHDGSDSEIGEWPSGVPLCMVNVFRVFATRVNDDTTLNASLKRKAGEAFEDNSKRRRPGAEHALPFPAIGPLPMFKHKFQLTVPSNANAGEILNEFGIVDGSSNADALDTDDHSSYGSEYDSDSETDLSSSPSCTLDDADLSFGDHYPPLSTHEQEQSILIQAQAPLQQPQLYQHAPVSQEALSTPFYYPQYATPDAYPSYTGYPPATSSTYAMPIPCRVAPVQPNFLGEIPADVLSASQSITRRSSVVSVPVSGSEAYGVDSSVTQQQQSIVYEKQPYVDPRQVYWTPPPPHTDYRENAYYHCAAQYARPTMPQQYGYRPSHGSYVGNSVPPYPYSGTTFAQEYSYPGGPAFMDTLPTYGHGTSSAASPSSIDYKRAIVIADGRLVYACHLCARGFDMPNGLGIHLRWHQRQEESETAEHIAIEEQIRRARQERQEYTRKSYIVPMANVSLHGDGTVAYGSYSHPSIHGGRFAQSRATVGAAADELHAPFPNSFVGPAQFAQYEARPPADSTYTTDRSSASSHVVPPISYGALAGAGWHTKRA